MVFVLVGRAREFTTSGLRYAETVVGSQCIVLLNLDVISPQCEKAVSGRTHVPIIFDSSCLTTSPSKVSRFPKAVHKTFKSETEAEQWVKAGMNEWSECILQ
jgi:hypothetical protein